MILVIQCKALSAQVHPELALASTFAAMVLRHLSELALYSGSNYAGKEKRAWYLRYAVVPTIRGVYPDVHV